MSNSFLHSVVDDLIRRFGMENLYRCTLVFPMQRAGLFVKADLSERVKQQNASGRNVPLVLPGLTTISSLADSLSALHSEDELLTICRLYEAYKQHVPNYLPFDIFFGWGRQLLSDFSNIDMAMEDIHGMLSHSVDSTRLDRMMLDEETRDRLLHLLGQQGDEGSVRRFFSEFWDCIPAIYDSFREKQEEAHAGTTGARLRWVIEHFDEVSSPLEGRTYVFVGFNYLLEAERRLMQKVREKTDALYYWDYDPSFSIDPEVYKFLRDDIALFGNALPDTQLSNSQLSNSPIHLLSCQSTDAQAQYVHQWLLAHHHEGQKTAVVLADESVLQSVIYALPNDLKVNVTKGYPLRQVPIFSVAMRLVEKDYPDVSPADVLQRVARGLEQDYKRQLRAERDAWYTILTDEAYYQTQLVIRELRSLLLENELVGREVSTLTMLRSLLRRQLETVEIPFHGEPITDIQIIGVLETRLLDFDNILILNAEEGVVPNTGADHSFLPYDLRRAVGMQTREEEAKIYAYNFFRLLRRADHVTVTFSEATTDTGKKTMSRFLMQLLAQDNRPIMKYRLTESDGRTPLILLETKLREEDVYPNHLSPSAISDFIECPREFYLKHIRGIREPETTSVLFSQSVFGTLVHDSLEAVYHDHLSIDEALDVAYRKANEKAMKHLDVEEPPYLREEHEAENYVVMRMVRTVMDKDKERPSTLVDVERKMQWSLQVGDKPFVIKGTIDRLDVLNEDGTERLRVLDYKTGGFKEDKMKIPSLEVLFSDPKKRYALQTLIYCAMLRHAEEHTRPIVPELFYLRNSNADPHLLLSNEPSNPKCKNYTSITDYEAQCAASFEALLQQMAETILSTTNFEMADNVRCEDSHCYCPFHELCGREKKEY